MPGYYVMRFGKTPHSLVGNAAGLKEPVYTQVRPTSASQGKAETSDCQAGF